MDSQASARQACRAGDCRVSLGHDGLQHAKKNSLKPHLGKCWKIPPDESGEFVARMEDVLDVCHRPYSAEFPVACMDESSRQLAGEVTRPMEMSPNHPRLVDGEYARNGVGETFAETGPLTGRRHIKVTDTRTMKDWAEYVREMPDVRYPASRKAVLVMENLNTHSIGSCTRPSRPPRRSVLQRGLKSTARQGTAAG